MGIHDVDTYVIRCQKMVSQYIATRPIKDLFLASERRPRTRVSKQRWEKDCLYLEGIWTAAQTEGLEREEREEDESKEEMDEEDRGVTVSF